MSTTFKIIMDKNNTLHNSLLAGLDNKKIDLLKTAYQHPQDVELWTAITTALENRLSKSVFDTKVLTEAEVNKKKGEIETMMFVLSLLPVISKENKND